MYTQMLTIVSQVLGRSPQQISDSYLCASYHVSAISLSVRQSTRQLGKQQRIVTTLCQQFLIDWFHDSCCVKPMKYRATSMKVFTFTVYAWVFHLSGQNPSYGQAFPIRSVPDNVLSDRRIGSQHMQSDLSQNITWMITIQTHKFTVPLNYEEHHHWTRGRS